MRIRTKAVATLLLSSLIPLAVTGWFAYTIAGQAIRANFSRSFMGGAHILAEHVQREVHEAYQTVQILAKLDIMQQVISGDADGRLTSFVLPLGRQFDYFADITVLNRSGQVIASNQLVLVGQDFSKTACFQSMDGTPHVGEAEHAPIIGEWVLAMAAPIWAAYDESEAIGVLCAHWKLKQLGKMLQEREQQAAGKEQIIVIRKDGLVIAASDPKQTFKRNLLDENVGAASHVLDQKHGTIIEPMDPETPALIAYAPASGYRDLPSLGWGILITQDTRSVFRPIANLRTMIVSFCLLVACAAVALSLMLTSQLTRPLSVIERASAQIAQGNFKPILEPAAQNEFSGVFKAFNRMTEDLSRQRAQLVHKEYVDNILNSMSDTMVVVDPQGLVQMTNRAACELLGYTSEEIVGKPIALIFPEDGSISRAIPSKSAGTSSRVAQETVYRAKGGRRIPVLFSSSTLYGTDGSIQGIVCVAQDITEQKATAAKLTQANEELALNQRVLLSTVDDLKRSHEQLKATQLQLIQAEKLESVGRLAAGVAHEVKNPLAILLMGVEYLSCDPLLSAHETASSVVLDMKQAILRADTVIRGLLDFASANRLDATPVSLSSVIDQALTLVKHELERRHITTVRFYGEDIPDLQLDRVKIEQVFVNLFIDAAHAMPQGGTLTVRLALQTLENLGSGTGNRMNDFFRVGERVVMVVVEDTGTGIRPEMLSKVFDPFFTTKPTGQGTGLGLTVVQKIVDMHSAAIRIENRGSGGLRVTLYFKMIG